jgi:hypothetical protein
VLEYNNYFFLLKLQQKPAGKLPICMAAGMWTPPGLGRNIDPEQKVMQQQFTGSIPPYQFQKTSHTMTPLEQTTINRTPSTGNNKYNTQNEPEIRTHYTWQQVKKRKRSTQTPETTTEGNPFHFNTRNRYEELSPLSDEDMQTNETNETATSTKNKTPRESKPPPIYIYISEA